MVSKFKPRGHVVDILFTLALFCVFAASSLMIVLIGADVYKNTCKSMNANYNMRTSLSYISTKIHQNDSSGVIQIKEIEEGKPALLLEQNLGGVTYETWIYENDDMLMELFMKKGTSASLKNGQNIMPIEDFAIESVEKNLYRIKISDNSGESSEMLVAVRSED